MTISNAHVIDNFPARRDGAIKCQRDLARHMSHPPDAPDGLTILDQELCARDQMTDPAVDTRLPTFWRVFRLRDHTGCRAVIVHRCNQGAQQ